jgi:hypothetical protein
MSCRLVVRLCLKRIPASYNSMAERIISLEFASGL